MAERFISERNLKFLLYGVFDAESLTRHPYFEQYDRKMFDMVLKAATELAEGLLQPNCQEMDRNPPELAGDQVKVHPSVRAMMKEFGMGGWIGATVPEGMGGEQLPHLVADNCYFIFAAANYSACAYAVLSAGVIHLLESFGSKELIDIYVPKILSGEWQGTMALTEPEAGSSLADITTMAEPADEGYYKIQGQKILISAGDHDAVENVVHLMLAKIKGAPPGVKGISLFVVPKKRIDKDRKLVPNDVVTSGIFHKLGYRGCPIVQLSMGDKNDCRGYLVGEPHNGLKYMFQMMNEERIAVGMGATAIASAAYYASLDYCKKRRQGRKVSEKDPARPQIPIIEHADVKRMLLFQRAVIEGSLSLLMQCSKYVDLQKVSSGVEKEQYNLLLEILTPVAKTYPSEMGILSISQGLQCFGGSGYCDDYPLEQYYRDARIHPIHEGTTGIQGIDLLGRKVLMKNGKALKLYVEEVQQTIASANDIPELKPYAEALEKALERLQNVTKHLLEVASRESAEMFLADATLYLEFFAVISIAWQWLLQGIYVQKGLKNNPTDSEADFLQGKFYTLRFFFAYELPKIKGLEERLRNTDGLTVEMEPDHFSD
ncbi:MAG: acyl-CoA dehydrogenase [Deltaproteobacteria bacterium]|nr:acyl-CoA dehydrogenase [Deltaproteobacteria bacterium]